MRLKQNYGIVFGNGKLIDSIVASFAWMISWSSVGAIFVVCPGRLSSSCRVAMGGSSRLYLAWPAVCACVFVWCDIVDLYFDPPVFGKRMAWFGREMNLNDFFWCRLDVLPVGSPLTAGGWYLHHLFNLKSFIMMCAIHRNPCHILCTLLYICISNWATACLYLGQMSYGL